MDGLIDLYTSMKEKGLDHTAFDYIHNNIKLYIFFDIETKPFRLLLIKKHSSITLLLEIHQGFVLNTHLEREKYNILREILEIKNGSTTSFSTNKFFEELNSHFPKEAKMHDLNKDKNIKLAISKAYQCEDAEQIYPYAFIDWDRIDGNKSYSSKNREKTRLLYPDIYKSIQNKNISVKYSSDVKFACNNKFSDIKKIQDK